MRRIGRRLSYANVVATMALFLALGGVGYAATQLPKNSVGSKQLKNGAVTATKISKSAKSALAGPAGPVGPQGLAGPGGAPGTALAYAKVFGDATLDTSHSKNVTAVVPACEHDEPGGCAVPPEGIPLNPDYCFKLNFVPNMISVTPMSGVIYNHEIPRFDAEVPGRGYSDLRGGCPVGYRDAEVRLSRETGEPTPGFFVVFN
jgi:hypothetical protein